MIESIKWIPVDEELPDDGITVLINHPRLDEPTWLGYYERGIWFTVEHERLPDNAVTHWADTPAGVEANNVQ